MSLAELLAEWESQRPHERRKGGVGPIEGLNVAFLQQLEDVFIPLECHSGALGEKPPSSKHLHIWDLQMTRPDHF